MNGLIEKHFPSPIVRKLWFHWLNTVSQMQGLERGSFFRKYVDEWSPVRLFSFLIFNVIYIDRETIRKFCRTTQLTREYSFLRQTHMSSEDGAAWFLSRKGRTKLNAEIFLKCHNADSFSFLIDSIFMNYLEVCKVQYSTSFQNLAIIF